MTLGLFLAFMFIAKIISQVSVLKEYKNGNGRVTEYKNEVVLTFDSFRKFYELNPDAYSLLFRNDNPEYEKDGEKFRIIFSNQFEFNKFCRYRMKLEDEHKKNVIKQDKKALDVISAKTTKRFLKSVKKDIAEKEAAADKAFSEAEIIVSGCIESNTETKISKKGNQVL